MAAIFAFHNDRKNQSAPEPIFVELCHGALISQTWIVSSGLFEILHKIAVLLNLFLIAIFKVCEQIA